MKQTLKRIARFLPEERYRSLASFYHRIFDRYPKITPLPQNMNSNLWNCYEWFQNAAHYLHVNRMVGVYAEFGCHEANTFRLALRTLGNYERWGNTNRIRHFYGFDSFEGMPEPEGIDRQSLFRAGLNCTSEEHFRKLCAFDLHRITTVKGFYHDTLPGYPWKPEHVIILAYIDCDYYASTVEVLRFLKDKLAHGAILAFDDWNCYYGDPERGEKKAFREFQENMISRVHFEPFLPISFGGMSFLHLKKELMGKDIL